MVWGPQAGYFAAHQPVPLTIAPVTPGVDGPTLPMMFDISMGLRKEDTALRGQLGDAMERNRSAIDRILADYGVPRTDPP
ncbi:hypothetical protein M5E06_16120 [Azospirillum sp. A1-3]|uniref:hypothetical protein n=1 Tax=Azospirillum sp. A1-3 TaxID=185874 RepID=UPI002076EB6A|nr:hypothetical protein [Azospirillum sp. A1-3]MCM8735675.1 hypothetical protein [Azospirillum sp. A1-3]